MVTAAIAAASLTGALALAAPAQAAAAPHANSSQTITSHTVSPAGTVSWAYYGTYNTLAECEAVGLAEYEEGEALDYLCSATETCPTRYQLYLEIFDGPIQFDDSALPARPAAASPAC